MKYLGAHVTYVFLVNDKQYSVQFKSPSLRKHSKSWLYQIFLDATILSSEIDTAFPSRALAARLLRAEFKESPAFVNQVKGTKS